MGEDIPFTTFVDLPGINPGDEVTITPVVEHVGFELIDPLFDDSTGTGDYSDSTGATRGSMSGSCYDPCDPYVEESEMPLFRRLIQRTVIQLVVRGSKGEAIRVATVSLPTSTATTV